MSGRRLSLAFGALACATALAALASPSAHAGTSACPPIANKPDQAPHVHYAGVEHLTYCSGPITVQPGQNIIRLNATNLFPSVPGYITRFDPELVYPDGTVPRVDILHLHHAVWIVNGNPQFATGEEKTILQLPQGFGWRSLPSDGWLLNDMLHDLVGKAARSTSSGAWTSSPTRLPPRPRCTRSTRGGWTSPDRIRGVGISSPIYPVFDALKGCGQRRALHVPRPGERGRHALIGPQPELDARPPA